VEEIVDETLAFDATDAFDPRRTLRQKFFAPDETTAPRSTVVVLRNVSHCWK
jgi:hypothetical protein